MSERIQLLEEYQLDCLMTVLFVTFSLSSPVQMIDVTMSTMECWGMLALSFYEWLVHFKVMRTDSIVRCILLLIPGLDLRR